MEKKNRKNDHSNKLRHLDMKTSDAASSTECTGLIPSAPASDMEQQAYEDIYEYGTERAEEKEGK